MANYYTILTALGKEKISNSVLLGNKITISEMLIGDGNGSNYEPTEYQTSLINQVYKADVISVSINSTDNNFVIVQAVIPPEVGGFFIRELGLTDHTGSLIAIAKFPETYKPIIKDGSVKEVVIKMMLSIENSEVVDITINEELIEGTITADNFSMYGITVVNKDTGVATLEITENGECYANFTELKIGGSSINALISNTVSESKDYADEKFSELEQTLEGFEFTVKDLQTAIVSVTDDGIKVLIKEDELDLGYSLINNEGITIYDSDDNKLAWFGDDDSAFIKKLHAEDIKCEKIIKKINPDDCPTNWYIGEEATGDGTGRDTSNVSNNLSYTMEYIKNNYGTYLNNIELQINVVAGTYEEYISISGFLGNGKIIINLEQGVVIYGRIEIYDNMPPVRILGNGSGTFENGAILYGVTDGIRVKNSHVFIKGIRSRQYGNLLSETVAGSFCVPYEGGNVIIESCDISGFNQIIYSKGINYVWNGHAKLYNNCGWCTRVVYSQYGNVLIGGTYPKISKVDYSVMSEITYLSGSSQMNSLLNPANETDDTDTPIPETPTVNTEAKVLKTFTASFAATKIYTTVEGSGLATSTKTDKTGQGYYGSYKKHRGHAIIPDSLVETLASATEWTIKVKLHRWSKAHGQHGAVPVPKFVTAINTTSTYSCGQAFALDDTYTVYVGDTLNNKIATGEIKDLQFYSTRANDYSFYDQVTFIVSYKKYI